MVEPQTLSLLCWNVFHGRDKPPDPGLFTARSRFARITEDNGTYIQVNRSLLAEFSGWIERRDWQVCLLQECPPAWARTLSARCRASGYRVLTSRNLFGPLRRALGRRSPDLIGANEGGSNLTLVRPPWRIVERTALLLNPLRERGLAERRRMALVRVRDSRSEVCVANLHASAGNEPAAEREIWRAATHATDWAAGTPLVFAGDFNLRPRGSPRFFDELERRQGLMGATAPAAIDHLLHAGLRQDSPTRQLPAGERELIVDFRGAPRKLRLSDHAPLEVSFSIPPGNMASMRYK